MAHTEATLTMEERIHRWEVSDKQDSLLEQSNRAVNRFNPYHNMSPISQFGPRYDRNGWLVRPKSAPGSVSRSGGHNSNNSKRRPPATAATARVLRRTTAETRAKHGEKLCINEELRTLRADLARVRQQRFAIAEKKTHDAFISYSSDPDDGLGVQQLVYLVESLGPSVFWDQRDLRHEPEPEELLRMATAGMLSHDRLPRADGTGGRAHNSLARCMRRCACVLVLLTPSALREIGDLGRVESCLVLRQLEVAVEQREKDGTKIVVLLHGFGNCEDAGAFGGESSAASWHSDGDGDGNGEAGTRRAAKTAAELEDEAELLRNVEGVDFGSQGRALLPEAREFAPWRSSSCRTRPIRDTMELALHDSRTAVVAPGDAWRVHGTTARLWGLISELMCDDAKLSMSAKALPSGRNPQRPEDDPLPVLDESADLFVGVGTRGLARRVRDMKQLHARAAGDRALRFVPRFATLRAYDHMQSCLCEAAERFRSLNTGPIKGRFGTSYERLRLSGDRDRKRLTAGAAARVARLARSDAARSSALARRAIAYAHFAQAQMLVAQARRSFAWAGVSERDSGTAELEQLVDTRAAKMRRAVMLEKRRRSAIDDF